MALVSVDLARASQRIDLGDEDALVQAYLDGAVQIAIDYLNRQVYEDIDEMAAAVLAGDAGPDPILINPAIRAGVLLIFGHLYAHRETVIVGVSAVELPMGAKSLLRHHRRSNGV